MSRPGDPDEPEHEMTIDCACLPSVEIVTDADGVAHELIVHNAWDGRP